MICGDLLPGLLLGQIGDLLCGHLTIEKRCEHQSARYTENVREYVPELDVPIFNYLLNPVSLP